MKSVTSASANQRIRRSWLALVFRFVVSGVLLFLVLGQVPVSKVLESLAGALLSPLWLLGAAALAGAGVALAVARWRGLIEGIGEPADFWQLFQAFLVGNFFNQFFPSTIGGDFARSWWIRAHLGSMTRSLTVVAFDRLLGIAGICFVGLLALIVRPDAVIALPELKIATGVLLAIIVGFWAVIHFRIFHVIPQALPDDWGEYIKRNFDEIAGVFGRLRRSAGCLFLAFMFAVTLQGVVILYFAALGAALGLDLTLSQFAILIPITSLLTAVPISINGIGIREASLVLFGSSFGLAVDDAVALAWLFLCVAAIYGLMGGVIFAVGRRRLRVNGDD